MKMKDPGKEIDCTVLCRVTVLKEYIFSLEAIIEFFLLISRGVSDFDGLASNVCVHDTA